MNKKIRRRIKEGWMIRNEITTLYKNYYFSLFENSKKWKGLTRDESHFIMTQFWEKGTVAGIVTNKEPLLISFVPYAPVDFNLYIQPIHAQAIRLMNALFVPTDARIVYKDEKEIDLNKIVLGYANPSKTPVRNFVFAKIDELVNIRMTMRTNLYAQKLSLLYAVTPENKDSLEDVISGLFNDDLSVAITADDVNSITGLKGTPTYILDKLREEYLAVQSELLTYLGIDNSYNDKRERVLVDEVNSNNDLIEQNGKAITDAMKDFARQLRECFGAEIDVEDEFVDNSLSIHEEKKGKTDDE